MRRRVRSTMAPRARSSLAPARSAAFSAVIRSPLAAPLRVSITARTSPPRSRSAWPVSPWRALPPPTTLWPCRRRSRRPSRRRCSPSAGSPLLGVRSMTARRPPWSRTPASLQASSAQMSSQSAVRPSDSITPRTSLLRTPSASLVSRWEAPTPGTTPSRRLRRYRPPSPKLR